MADTTTSFGRRVFLRSATAAATIATIELTGAGTATAHDRHGHGDDHHRHDHRGRAPHTVALPDGLQPEGITSGPGTRYYVGSLADGRIITGDLLAATSSVLLAGTTGRSLRGLKWDPRTNLVWAVGSLGTTGKVYAVNGRTGAVVADVTVPGAKFLNDLVVTSRAVWVTDSYVDRLTRVPLHHGGAPSGVAPAYLPLRGAWPAGNGKDFWANGIRQLPDGRLVLNNSTAGGLWQVDRATGVARSIPVSGGPAITSGDGLELRGDVLYNVRGTGGNDVAVLRLHRRHDGWEARWRDDLTDPTLDTPSTATLAGGWLWAVNARFGVASPTTAHYWITRLPAQHHWR
ncbi:hypothetical protein SAMN05216199_2869 [Pedococcus cremeus]|uniref:Superoxide dismutase n=1 Tax=Pedococcus cremeus TaxID=587636 RepID=A0A1H9WFU6_9MICO|nr:hypothetical protein [Pedococcus cremeus]SES32659.1 hypothetical protein SAMN05216199_2869 [Pedococcus cremeus]